jgi:hypothetical protein
MTTPHLLAFTDDEAAAVAWQSGGAWRAPLPTVEATNEADLAAAILRGTRSLLVRDLAKPDGNLTGAAAAVLAALGKGPCAIFLLVDDYDRWYAPGLTVYLYGAGPDQADLSQVVGAAGIHYFQLPPHPGQWHALTEVASAVFESGFAESAAGARNPAAAILTASGSAGPRSIRVAQGKITTANDSVPQTFDTITEALAWTTA